MIVLSFPHVQVMVIVAGLIATAVTPSIATSETTTGLWNHPVNLGEVRVSLPSPTMPDGLDTARQSDVLKLAAGKYSLDRFTKNSIVAPLHLQRTTIKDSDGNRVGHQIDLWFIAHGEIDVIKSEEMFASLVDSERNAQQGSGDRVPPAELAQRGINADVAQPASTDGGVVEGYYRFSVPVLDRVVVEGVVRTHSSNHASSYLAGFTLAEEFDQDTESPNLWKHRSEEASEGTPYRGCAGYAKATELLGYEGAILIECHAAVHEPKDWFGGANLLGSKLPIAVQNSVRKFRRALAKQ